MEQDDQASVSAHYTSGDLGEKILVALRAAGKNPDALTLDDLAPVDQFHLGGKPATRALIAHADFAPGARILDVGGGLGGPARTLATEADCTVTVLDLSAEFCRVGAMLTTRTGLADRVTFRHGNALAMPFPDGSFDGVWTQHATMNIADKARLYTEIYRVLRPGGRFAMHDALAGPVQPIHFPAPWAREPAISFLRTPEEIRALLADAGFREIVWVDERATVIEVLRKQATSLAARGAPPPLGIHIVMGAGFSETLHNVARNVGEDRLTIAQAVFERP